jgi:predicted  nucleic acid-binding Zn-ribbon protein
MTSMTKKQLEDVIEGLNGKLDGMDKKIDALESLPARLAKMEKLLTKVNEENGILRKAMQQKEEQINSLSSTIAPGASG